MERLTLQAEIREGRGKGVARRLRAEGKIPAVVYGKNREPVSLIVDEKDLFNLLGKQALIDLKFGNEEEVTLLKDYQRDPIKGFFIHADFQAIVLGEKITITVPLHFEGTPVGVQEGGILQTMLREVEVECLPTEMPDNITLDISELGAGASLLVEDIETEEGIEIITDPDEAVATIVAPETLEEEDEEGEEEVLEEPEVIGAEDEEEEAEEE